MLDETFFLDGVNARSVGIRLQAPIEFTGIEPIVETISIPGRNGDLTIDTGAFKNRKGNAKCFALSENVQTVIDSANRFLFEKAGYRRLECSNDLDHFWLARIANGARIEDRLKRLSPFEITFDCFPQRFEKSGEQTVVFVANGSIYNQFGGVALPLIKLYGNGSGTLTVGGYNVVIKSMQNVLFLDSDSSMAYNKNNENQSQNISAKEFPKLVPGENRISFSGGVTKIEIIPRWWSK